MTNTNRSNLTAKIRNEADEIREVTLDEAKALPGMLGRMCFSILSVRGWYACKVGEKNVLFVAK